MEPTRVNGRVPGGGSTLLHRIAAVCGQLLVIAVLLWIAGKVLAALAAVIIPVVIALLLAALFASPAAWLARHGLPHWLAATLVLLGGLAAVGGLVLFVVRAIVTGLPDLQNRLTGSYHQLRDWLANGPLGLGSGQLDQLVAEVRNWLSRNRQELVSGAWGVFSTAGSILAGLAMALFILIFFVYQGRGIWQAVTRPVPEPARDTTRRAGARTFHDLSAFAWSVIAVALMDAVGIGLGLWITGVPLVIPLAALVFLGAFVPYVGAFVSGLLAVLVALVSQGPVIALVVVGIVIVVQVLEGNVFQPFITGHAVQLHPVAVVLAVAVGVTQAGIIGALLAVPLLTAIRAVTATVRESRRTANPQ